MSLVVSDDDQIDFGLIRWRKMIEAWSTKRICEESSWPVVMLQLKAMSGDISRHTSAHPYGISGGS